MAPTVQTNENAPEKSSGRGQKQSTVSGEKKSDLVCKVKYSNNLPDIPFDLKFITYPFESLRFIQYNPTSLERNYRYEVLTEHDMGVTIDLIDKDAYNCEFGAQLDVADEKLLEEEILTPQDSKRSRHHARNVSWLRRTEYISTEQTRFQPQTMDKVEAKVGHGIKKSFKDETLYMDRESQIKAIEKTFVDATEGVEKHYSKPGVYPVEILPIFPDFKLWKYPCAQVIFDSDPAPVGKNVPAQIEEMSQAMIRGVMDESGAQFVAYFLPCEETLEKRKRDFTEGVAYQDDEEYEYKMAREYNWNVKSKASKGYEENYFFVIRDGGVYYDELETRVRLSKRRQKVGQAVNNTRLVVKHRPLNANEFRMQRFRERQLEPPCDEEEEEEPQEEEEAIEETQEDDEQQETQNQSGNESGDAASRKSRSKSRSRSKSGSRSRSRSKSGSRSRSRSKSASSRSRSRSKSKSHSRSRSKSGSKSRSPSGSRENSPAGSRRSKSGSRRSKSGSRRSKSGSRRSKSGSRSRSGSRSSRSRSGSKSRSPSGSRDNSPAAGSRRSRSRSARSGSARSSKSGSAKSSRSGSAQSGRSGSARSGSARSGSGSNRSRSGSRSGSSSGGESD